MALSPLGIAIMQSQTQPAPARPGSVTPTDTLGAYQLSGNMAEQQYQAQLAQQNALWGGLAGLGSAGIIGASKVPGVTNTLSNWLVPGSAGGAGGAAATPAAGTIGAAATDFGNSYPLAGLGADAFAPGASVASDVAAATPAVADAGTSALSSGFGAAIPFLAALFGA